jgi:hypothetical protein
MLGICHITFLVYVATYYLDKPYGSLMLTFIRTRFLISALETHLDVTY